jgi:predicted lipoprotein with Yx(FWY)xxD motif
MSRSVLVGGGLAAVAVLLAACGGSSSPSSSPSSSQPAPSTSSSPSSTTGTAPGATGAAVSLSTTSLGNVLVNAQGFTLYLFQADTATKSACSGACASVWPPATATATGAPVAGSGLTASLLTTLTRADGTKQLEYNGHPLYTYAGDSAAGQTTGEGNTSFGAGWFVVDAGGNKV